MQVLVVVDMQNDFVSGALGTPEAREIVSRVADRAAAAKERGEEILFTRDTHEADYLDTQEGRKLPVPHCLLNADGWQLYGQTGQAMERSRDMVIGKGTFPSLWLANWLKGQGYDQVELAGLVSYLCVLSNAVMVKAALPEAELVVDASCTAGPDPALHAKGLDVMEALQITVLNR